MPKVIYSRDDVYLKVSNIRKYLLNLSAGNTAKEFSGFVTFGYDANKLCIYDFKLHEDTPPQQAHNVYTLGSFDSRLHMLQLCGNLKDTIVRSAYLPERKYLGAWALLSSTEVSPYHNNYMYTDWYGDAMHALFEICTNHEYYGHNVPESVGYSAGVAYEEALLHKEWPAVTCGLDINALILDMSKYINACTKAGINY